MNFLCPACRTALPRSDAEVVPCTGCGVQVDLTRLDTAPGAAPLRPDVDLTGETLGGYRLGKRLGAGGMGIVYEAEGPGGKCAVKVLGALLASDPALRTRFRREAAALEAIRHPNVVRVLGDGEERGFSWYAMELVEGSDLRTRLARGPLSPAEVVALSRALLGALEEVHARGFVHRDVKPGNVLLTKDGAPKLCDFGIARYDGATTLTESAAILGSLRYMAPEQRLGRAGPPADLYALGVTLHEALAGGVPDEKPLPSSTPRALRKMVEALCAPRAMERPPSANDALAMLDRRLAPRLALAASLLVVVGASVALAMRPSPPANGPAELKNAGLQEQAAKDEPLPPPPVPEPAPQADEAQAAEPKYGNAPPTPAEPPVNEAQKLAPQFDSPTPKPAQTQLPVQAQANQRPATQVDLNDAFTSKLTMPGGIGTRATTERERKQAYVKKLELEKKRALETKLGVSKKASAPDLLGESGFEEKAPVKKSK